MLTDLLFGSYRRKVLSQLLINPDEDYHVRELARLTDTSPGTLHKELARLAESGLLLRRTSGNQVRYQANRQCPVFPELAGLMRKTTGAALLIGQALGPLEPLLALIFGSVARGTQGPGSDVDVMVITDRSFGDVVRALHPVQLSLGREINPVVYDPAEFAQHVRSRESFVVQVLAEPRILVIGTEDDLNQLAGRTAPAGV
jgi:DNA-binding transcriptional ArsR family regulator